MRGVARKRTDSFAKRIRSVDSQDVYAFRSAYVSRIGRRNILDHFASLYRCDSFSGISRWRPPSSVYHTFMHIRFRAVFGRNALRASVVRGGYMCYGKNV